MGAGERDSRRFVFGEVAPLLVAARLIDARSVVNSVHWLYDAYHLRRIHSDKSRHSWLGGAKRKRQTKG